MPWFEKGGGETKIKEYVRSAMSVNRVSQRLGSSRHCLKHKGCRAQILSKRSGIVVDNPLALI